MSLYDFYMYLKHIEHSPENLEFYVWYISIPDDDGGIVLMAPRFKNFEAGRLTSLSELPREKTGSQEHTSEFGSETDLSNADIDEKSIGATVTEKNGEFDLEDHGRILTVLSLNPRVTLHSQHRRDLRANRKPCKSYVRLPGSFEEQAFQTRRHCRQVPCPRSPIHRRRLLNRIIHRAPRRPPRRT